MGFVGGRGGASAAPILPPILPLLPLHNKREQVLATMPSRAATPSKAALAVLLETFRASAASTKGVSASRILSNAQLDSIASAAPQDLAELGAIKGVGKKTVDVVGADLVHICRGNSDGPSDRGAQRSSERAAGDRHAEDGAADTTEEDEGAAGAHGGGDTEEDEEQEPGGPGSAASSSPGRPAPTPALGLSAATTSSSGAASGPPLAGAPPGGRWQWLDNRGAFTDYSIEHSNFLEREFQALGRFSGQIRLPGKHGWIIDLDKMTQSNTSAKWGRSAPVRKVRRFVEGTDRASTSKRPMPEPDSGADDAIAHQAPQPVIPPAKRARPTVSTQRVSGSGGAAADSAALRKSEEAQLERVAAAASSGSGPILLSGLSAEQAAAAERALSGESLFLTGAAGTGKSHLLKYIIQELTARHGEDKVAVTAPTGIAAINVGGVTIHSFAGIGQGRGDTRALVEKVFKNSKAKLNWTQTSTLVLDEVSMLSNELFDLLDHIGRKLRGQHQQPFGGMQLILCGDFFQLPPVKGRYAFQGRSWSEANLQKGTVVLKQAHRQQDDAAFAALLNQLRLGILTDQAMAALHACSSRTKPAPTDDIIPTKLYCTNADVDAENNNQLRSLGGDAVTFTSVDQFKGASQRSAQQALCKKMDAKVRKTASFFEFSLCLFRACLGKMIVFIYKWRQNAVFRRSWSTSR